MIGRLAAQIGFIPEIDRLKQVIRRGTIADGTRRENTAEHSWFLAMMVRAEARFAHSVDRLAPLLLNHAGGGQPWGDHGIVEPQVRAANGHIGDGSAALGILAGDIIDAAVEAGMLGER